ncbi:MAG: ABC transporter substrate-binding protein [Deltaproteobacteria bacterium]|nr:ABC transporter substrate-binding protein [Deltaproteobacteria bacterium]
MKRPYSFSATIFFLLLFIWHNSSQARTEKITIGYSALGPTQTSIWIPKESRSFEKYGLDVTLVLINGGLRTIQSLIAGDISFAHAGGEAALVANLKGADTTIIATNEPILTYKLIGRKIKSLDELKRATSGLKLGIQSFGSMDDFVARKMAALLGLSLGKDIILVAGGQATERLAALSKGLIDLSVMKTALPTRMLKGGFHVLFDMTTEASFPYHGMGLSTKRELVRRNPDLVRSVIKAYVEGIKIYKTDAEFSAKVRAKYTRRSDMDELQEEWRMYVDVVPKMPYPTIDGIKAMLADLSSSFSEARKTDAARYYDDSFVRELEVSGFINNLYRPGR